MSFKRGRVNLKIIFILLILICSIFIAGCKVKYICADGSEQVNPKKCKKQYFCFDGKEATDKRRCSFVEIAPIVQKDANEIALSYVNAYTALDKVNAKLINSYEFSENETAGYVAKLVVQLKEGPYETTLKINGKTGEVICTENCQYTK
ncbi:hypothetical protein HN587_00075 [Candidatus Woesearchaeota archaeon]|jgi:hypothetical protein|nr:hypothetical protein [Candidatus Woesearchaeota archaeon]